jgi:hypothetical protein
MALIKTASVKIMLSYDYSHFETSMSIENDDGLTDKEIDMARKQCQRLCDKAVYQYKKAKEMAALRNDGQYMMKNFEEQCKTIAAKNEHDRTLKEIGMLKEYQDEKWRDKFGYHYDYEDEEQDDY